MTDNTEMTPLMLLLGAVVLVSTPVRCVLEQVALPGLVGFIGLGILLSFLDHLTGLLSGFLIEQSDVLARFGVNDSFAYVLALFGPFLFLSIGLSVGFERFGQALSIAAVLFVAMAGGKLVGAGLPAWLIGGRRSGRLIGASMTPRTEIFLIVVLHGLALGSWAMPEQVFNAAVLAAVATCIAGPLAVVRQLNHAQHEEVRP